MKINTDIYELCIEVMYEVLNHKKGNETLLKDVCGIFADEVREELKTHNFGFFIKGGMLNNIDIPTAERAIIYYNSLIDN